MPRARAIAARRVSRSGRHVQPRGGQQAFRHVRRGRRRARRSTTSFAPSRAGRPTTRVVPVENSTEGAVGRTLDLMVAHRPVDLRRSEAAREAEPAVQRRRASTRSRASIRTGNRSRNACSGWRSTCRRFRASPWRATPRRRGLLRPSQAPRRSPAKIAAAIYGLADARAAHRGRAQQHDALLGARPPAASAPRAATRPRS